jgi:hypothetical protein
MPGLIDDRSKKKITKWFGTQDDAVFWLNTTDSAGLGFSSFVLCSIAYAGAVTILVVIEGDMAVYNATIILFLVFMSLWSQLRTMMSDPGAVPPNAHPLLRDNEDGQIVCGRCECYKPPSSHHGKIFIILIHA